MRLVFEFSAGLTQAVSNINKRCDEYIISRHNEHIYVILSCMASNSCDIHHVWDIEFHLFCNVASSSYKLNAVHAATQLFSARGKGA
jgi:hypothetical protein